MALWTKVDLIALDRKYAEAGVSPHQRPMRAAADLLGGAFSLGSFANPEVKAITDAYRGLFPEVEQTWPGAGIGLIASVDQVRKFRLGAAFGRVSVPIWRGVGFDSLASWEAWCRHDSEIAAETALALADVHDFSSGVEIVSQQNAESAKRWHMAASNLSDVANVLPTTFSVDSVLQPICLVVELSLKASLLVLGQDLRGHKLPTLAEALAGLRPHRDDVVIKDALSAFPNYVGSRYEPEGRSRYQVVRLALAAQFIAASSVRRISPVDMAFVMEEDTWPGPRRKFLPTSQG